MRIFQVFLTLILVQFVLVGCVKEKSNYLKIEDASDINLVSIQDSKRMYDNFFDFFDLDSVVILETSYKSFIAEINVLEFKQGRIYILDKPQNGILIFDSHGKFLTNFNAQGEGPMEYSRIDDFNIFQGDLYVVDPDNNKMVIYNSELKPVKEISNVGNFGSFIMLGRDKFVCYAKNLLNDETQVNDFQYNNLFFRDFESVGESYLPFHISHHGQVFTAGTEENTFFESTNKLYFYHPTMMTVYQFNGNDVPSCCFKLTDYSDDYNIATMEASEYRNRMKEIGKPRLLNGIRVDKDYIFYQYNINEPEYSGEYKALFVKSTKKNLLFNSRMLANDLGFYFRSISYKGEDKGLVCFINPGDVSEIKRDKIPKKLCDIFEKIDRDDNPILLFLKPKQEIVN